MAAVESPRTRRDRLAAQRDELVAKIEKARATVAANSIEAERAARLDELREQPAAARVKLPGGSSDSEAVKVRKRREQAATEIENLSENVVAFDRRISELEGEVAAEDAQLREAEFVAASEQSDRATETLCSVFTSFVEAYARQVQADTRTLEAWRLLPDRDARNCFSTIYRAGDVRVAFTQLAGAVVDPENNGARLDPHLSRLLEGVRADAQLAADGAVDIRFSRTVQRVRAPGAADFSTLAAGQTE